MTDVSLLGGDTQGDAVVLVSLCQEVTFHWAGDIWLSLQVLGRLRQEFEVCLGYRRSSKPV